MKRRTGPRRTGESGYAMLLLFAMASVMAIMLYMALPRVAFEAQRDQEGLLIERGEQYKRAIQVYYRKFKRYPAKIEDLENTNNLRFLRHKYVDPMTGKDEWRLIHIGAGGLTDSLIKKKTDKDKKESVNNFITELQPIGGGDQPGGPPNLALRRRPSEGQPAGGVDASGLLVNTQQQTGYTPQSGFPTQPGFPTQSGFPTQPGVPGVPSTQAQAQFAQGQIPPGQFPPSGVVVQGNQFTQRLGGVPGQFPQQTPNSAAGSGQSGGMIGVLPGIGSTYPGPAVNSQTGGVSPTTPYPTTPGAFGSVQPPFPQPGSTAANPSQVPNAATQMIQNLLTTPRPGGLPAGVGGSQGTQFGGGLAGVASNAKRTGIKIYNEQDEYNKWEFVYDFSKDKSVNPLAGVQGPQQATTQGLNGPGLNSNPTATAGTVVQPSIAPPQVSFQPGAYPQPQIPGGAPQPANGFPQPSGFPQPNVPMPGMPQNGVPQPTVPLPGMPQTGFPGQPVFPPGVPVPPTGVPPQ